eukprot:4704931-Pyramimonas_sp.AAC.1
MFRVDSVVHSNGGSGWRRPARSRRTAHTAQATSGNEKATGRRRGGDGRHGAARPPARPRSSEHT